MTDFRVNVILDPAQAKKGADEVGKALDNTGRKALTLQSLLSKLFVGISVATIGKQYLELSNTFQTLQNRLRAVSDEGADLAAIQEQIRGVADRSRASLEATTELYTRLIVSSKELGKTQQQILQFTERLNKAIVLSGASASEAQSGIIQLSQGLSSGALRGDELRSVLEQLPAVADTIAKGLGVTRGELRRLGSEGKLTAQAIFSAFEKLGPQIDANFGKTIPTLSQNFTLLNNEILQFVGGVDQASGVTRGLGSALAFMAESIKEAREFYSGFAEDLRQQQADQALTAVGASIQSIRREIQALQARPIVTDGDLARIAELNKQLEGFQNLARKSTTLAPAVDVAAQQAAAAAQAEALAAQKAALDSIRGPQEEYKTKLGAINALLADGRITQEEYNLALEGLEKGLQKVAGPDAAKAFQEQNRALQEQIDLQFARLAFGDVVAERLAIEQELARQNITLTDEQKQQLEKQLAIQKQLQKVEEDRTEAAQEREAAAEREKSLTEALIAQLDVQKAISDEEQRLNYILTVRPDLIDQVNEKLEDLRLRSLESSTSLGDGFERAFIKIRREANDLASVGENIVDVFANRATDALIEFAETGKFSFEEFAQAILSDLTKILARLLIIQALSAVIGGGSSTGAAVDTGLSLAARAEGGPVSAGRSYLVGENGPELFTPTQSGTITPNGAPVAAPPEVKLQVVNVQDPKFIPEAINSGIADQAFINVLSRNKEAVRNVMA